MSPRRPAAGGESRERDSLSHPPSYMPIHPLSPVVAIPSTKYFCAKIYSSTGGSIVTNDIAISWSQCTVSATSNDILSARDTGYFFTLLI